MRKMQGTGQLKPPNRSGASETLADAINNTLLTETIVRMNLVHRVSIYVRLTLGAAR